MKTTRIMIVTAGGQGNISAARLLGEAAVAGRMAVRWEFRDDGQGHHPRCQGSGRAANHVATE